MKSKNQKEIDDIVEAIEQYTAMWDILIEGLFAKEFATSILSKLKRDEIILAKGKVENYNGEYWIGDNSEYSMMSKIKELEGKKGKLIWKEDREELG